MSNSRFPFEGDYKNAALANINLDKNRVEQIFTWANDARDMLILMGEPGTGKTYFSSAFYHYYSAKGKNIVIFNETDYFCQLRSIINQKWEPVIEVEKFCGADVVILDDMGSSQLTPWQKDMLFALVDKRVESRAPTIITSNLFLKDIKENFHERFYSRISAKRNLIIELKHDLGNQDLRKIMD